jgi:AmmeMemoRadiSam system protein A
MAQWQSINSQLTVTGKMLSAILIFLVLASPLISQESQGEVPMLGDQEKQVLLSLARTTVERVVRGDEPPPLPEGPPNIKQQMGAFVTLHWKGHLRGCIGMLEARAPLDETVREMAEAAALRDFRFQPVSPEELPDIDVEISALSPLRRIDDIKEIEVGTHGIWITRGMNRGVLLPQVATEQGYDRLTFLQQTCRKAGLPIDAWREPGTIIEIFSAEVFGEKDVAESEGQ